MPQVERGNPRARRSAVPNGHAEQAGALGKIAQRAGDDKDGKPDRERRQRAPPRVHAHSTAIAISAATPAAIRRCAAPSRSPRFHASSGPNGTAISSGTISGAKVRLKNGAPTEILSPVSDFQRQRIQRSDEHRGAGGGEEQVVEHQRAFAADRREQAALLQRRGAPGIERRRRR